jgi:hypothetical protein
MRIESIPHECLEGQVNNAIKPGSPFMLLYLPVEMLLMVAESLPLPTCLV